MAGWRFDVGRKHLWEVVLRYALVNNQRVEAAPKLKGLCPGCSQPVIAKCGPRRIKHWAHSIKRTCDNTRWETEGEWHRAWKNHFPAEWQEFGQLDEQGKRHIADVRTPHGLVIEFQHSHLDPQERAARERFYGNMVWVVDGTRLKRDHPRFLQGRREFRPQAKEGIFLVFFAEECLPANWVDSSVPVFFDFRGAAPTVSQDQTLETLWCLLPDRAQGNAVVIAITYAGFVARSSSRSQLLPAQEIISAFRQQIKREQDEQEQRFLMELRQQDQRRKRTGRRL